MNVTDTEKDKTIKVKLVAAHQVSFSNAVSLCNCLGILQLAAILKKKNIPCDVVDLEEFNHLYDSDFNQTMDAVTEKIFTSPPHSRPISDPPDLLGVSSMANNIAVAVEICRRAKTRFPQVITVLGGPGVSFCAREVLSAFPWIDTVIRGEADTAFPDYIEALASDVTYPPIKGTIFLNSGAIIDNGWPEPMDNLEEFPVPAYEFCNAGSFAGDRHEALGDYNGISIEAGRGCPFKCTFCSTSHYFKRRHRLKPVQRIIDEILYTREKLGDQRIIFTHDIMTLRHEYMEELCREIETRMPGLAWKCHARFDSIDKPLLEKMRRAGCNEIFFGIEAATPRMQKIIKKQLDLTGFEQKIMWLKELDFRFSLSYIVGIPGEEPEDMEAMLGQAIRAKSLCGDNVFVKIHTLVPVPGSELYGEWKDRLVYDHYGSLGTSDIPVHWTELRDMIQSRPKIFSLYYHLPIGEDRRIRSNKYAMVGTGLDSLMQYSMKLAYMVLGERLAVELAKHIDEIQLPPPASFKDTDYSVTCESLRLIVREWFDGDPGSARKYDAVALFEIALQHVLKHRDLKHSRVIETYYNPRELIDEIRRGTVIPGSGVEDNKMYFMILWDAGERKVKFTQVPPSFYSLMEKEPIIDETVSTG